MTITQRQPRRCARPGCQRFGSAAHQWLCGECAAADRARAEYELAIDTLRAEHREQVANLKSALDAQHTSAQNLGTALAEESVRANALEDEVQKYAHATFTRGALALVAILTAAALLLWNCQLLYGWPRL